MSKLWQLVLLLIVLLVLLNAITQLIQALWPWLVGAALVGGAVWVAVKVGRWRRGGW
jgi:hypothetical protein